MPNPVTLKHQLEDVRSALAVVAGRLAELRAAEPGGDEERVDLLDGLALIVGELGEASRELAATSQDAEALMYDRMGERRCVIPGRGLWERGRTATKERFESHRLLNLLMSRASADPETGEALLAPEMRQRLADVLEAALPVTPSLGWRKKGLDEQLGDGWRADLHSQEKGRKTVRRL